MLVCTKVDLESDRQVDPQAARKLVSTLNLNESFECSSLINININIDEILKSAIELGLTY